MKRILSILSFLSLFLFLNSQELIDFDYYREITLNTSTPVDNFQISLNLTTSNFDYSKVEPDGSDMRFALMNGTLLPYWIETWNPAGVSTIWLNIADAGTSSLSMFYGNSEAISQSNGSATFDYYFDFETGNLSDWSFDYSTNGQQSGSVTAGDWQSGMTSSNPIEDSYSAFSKAYSAVSTSPWNVKAVMHKVLSGGSNNLIIDADLRFDDAAEGNMNNGTCRFLVRFFNDDRSLNYQYGFDEDGYYGNTSYVVSDGEELHLSANFTNDFFEERGENLTDNYYLEFFSMADYAEYTHEVASTHTTIDEVRIRKTASPSIIADLGDESGNPFVPAVGVIFISEVADAASDFNAEYLELYNNSDYVVDLSNSKLVMLDDNNSFPIINYPGDTEIPANGFFIIARGATLAEFETEWGALPANCNYNEGSSGMYFGTGSARRWQFVFDDEAKADIIIDDTQAPVGGTGNRSYQHPIGTWNTDALANANPGELNNDQVLPITLSYFNADYQNGYSTVNWQTESEVNNSHWNVYRAESSEFYLAVKINETQIEGQGTTTEPYTYSYIDNTELSSGETYYYWIESVDYSGQTNRFGSISIEAEEENIDVPASDMTALLGNYPNPFNPKTTIRYQIKEDETAILEIFNVKGQIIESVTLTETTSEGSEYDFEGSKFGSGIFFYRLKTDSYSEVKKMIMLK